MNKNVSYVCRYPECPSAQIGSRESTAINIDKDDFQGLYSSKASMCIYRMSFSNEFFFFFTSLIITSGTRQKIPRTLQASFNPPPPPFHLKYKPLKYVHPVQVEWTINIKKSYHKHPLLRDLTRIRRDSNGDRDLDGGKMRGQSLLWDFKLLRKCQVTCW